MELRNTTMSRTACDHYITQNSTTKANFRYAIGQTGVNGETGPRSLASLGAGIMDALMPCRLSLVLIPLVASGLCAAADIEFADGLYPVLQKANCRTCHVDGGIASATRLLFPEP